MPAKILIVEDEAITAIDIKNVLESVGFEVVSIASEGKEAIKKAEEFKPDLILMDICLKGEIDGIEAADKIMNSLDIPVIYLTAFSDKKTFERVKLTEPYGFLTKPFDQEGLVGSIETALYKHELDKKLKESEKKFQLLYQDAPLPYQSLNESGLISDVNQSWLDTLGYSRDEVIGKWFGDFLKTNSAEEFMENFPKFKAKGEMRNIEFEMKRKNGSIIIAEFNGKISHDEQGNFQRTHCIFQDITKQKEAEKKIRESKERYKQFFDNPLNGFALCEIITDKRGEPIDFVYLKVNKAFEVFTGLKKEEVLNKRVTEVLVPEEVADIIKIYGKVALTGESTQLEYLIPSLDKYYEIAAFSPRKKQFIAFFTDITERKKAEEALLESEQRMNRSQEIAHIGSWELDIVNDHLFWSDEVYRIFGLQPQEFGATYEAFLEAIYPDDREAVDEAYFGSIREGRDTYEIEHRVLRKSTGGVRFVHEKCEHFRDESGQIIRSVGMVHDITDRRKIEEELRQARDHLEKIVQERTEELEKAYESLKESEEKFRLIFNEAEDSIVLNEMMENGLPGKIIEANEVTSKRLGYTKEELLNMTPKEIIAPEKLVEMPKNAEKLRREGHAIFEIIHMAKDGRRIPVEVDNHIIDFKGKKTALTVIRDITNRKEMEKQLKETINELERSNEELKTFAYITSHDLQEPLRTISSYAGLLKRRYEGQLDKDADEFIEFMVDGAARMKNMIQSLLDYSRVGTKDSEFKEFNAEEALKQALSNLQSSIDECHAEVIYDLLPVIHADESQISRVFQNLMGNALKFRKEGVKPKIHISAKKEGKEWIFSVRDNGIGMEEQYTHKIFQVFRRLHTMDEYHGTGIGLAIVKKIIELHGGRVWVESEFSKGSTFYFTIPIFE